MWHHRRQHLFLHLHATCVWVSCTNTQTKSETLSHTHTGKIDTRRVGGRVWGRVWEKWVRSERNWNAFNFLVSLKLKRACTWPEPRYRHVIHDVIPARTYFFIENHWIGTYNSPSPLATVISYQKRFFSPSTNASLDVWYAIKSYRTSKNTCLRLES